jgi:Asparagine synthase
LPYHQSHGDSKPRESPWESRVLYFLFGPLLFPDVGCGLFVMTPERQRSAALHPDFLAAVRYHDPRGVLESRIPDSVKDYSERLMHVYLKVYLPTLFIQEDKVGMAHSIEARVPICDNELIDFACSLSLEQKLHAGNLKSIPRDACRSLLPRKILTMPKRGFPTPFAHWFRDGRLTGFIVDHLQSRRARERGIFNSSEIDKWVDQIRNSKLDTLLDYARANRLYSAALVEQWHRTFIDGDRAAGHPNLPRPGAYAQSLA